MITANVPVFLHKADTLNDFCLDENPAYRPSSSESLLLITTPLASGVVESYP